MYNLYHAYCQKLIKVAGKIIPIMENTKILVKNQSQKVLLPSSPWYFKMFISQNIISIP